MWKTINLFLIKHSSSFLVASYTMRLFILQSRKVFFLCYFQSIATLKNWMLKSFYYFFLSACLSFTHGAQGFSIMSDLYATETLWKYYHRKKMKSTKITIREIWMLFYILHNNLHIFDQCLAVILIFKVWQFWKDWFIYWKKLNIILCCRISWWGIKFQFFKHARKK